MTGGERGKSDSEMRLGERRRRRQGLTDTWGEGEGLGGDSVSEGRVQQKHSA